MIKQLQVVDSSMVHAVGYDPEERVLEVVFTSGKVYIYEGVPLDIYKGLMAAQSKGSYMQSMIIDVYPDYKLQHWNPH